MKVRMTGRRQQLPLSDEALCALHRRMSAIYQRDGWAHDHYYICVIIADLASLPFERVFDACLDA